MSTGAEKPSPSLDSVRLEQRKRQVERRLSRICPGIRDEELAEIVDRVARMELQHELARLGFEYRDLDVELAP